MTIGPSDSVLEKRSENEPVVMRRQVVRFLLFFCKRLRTALAIDGIFSFSSWLSL